VAGRSGRSEPANYAAEYLAAGADVIGRVALRADRKFLAGARYLRAVDAGGEQLVDAAVALRAGARDVRAVHAGARVFAGQLMMSGVAVRAIRGNGQAAFERAFSMDALPVVLHHVVLRSVYRAAAL
jgi:hypothetical protein